MSEYDPTKDYCFLMGVQPDDDADKKKKRYRWLATRCHPDVNGGDKNAEAWFKELTEAYEVVSNPDRMGRYIHDRAIFLSHGPADKMYLYRERYPGYQGRYGRSSTGASDIEESRRIMKAMMEGEVYSFTEEARPAAGRNVPAKCR